MRKPKLKSMLSTQSATSGDIQRKILWSMVVPYLTSLLLMLLKYSVPQNVTKIVSNQPSPATSHGFFMYNYSQIQDVSYPRMSHSKMTSLPFSRSSGTILISIASRSFIFSYDIVPQSANQTTQFESRRSYELKGVCRFLFGGFFSFALYSSRTSFQDLTAT